MRYNFYILLFQSAKRGRCHVVVCVAAEPCVGVGVGERKKGGARKARDCCHLSHLKDGDDGLQ